jgi:hypothetical protein
MVHCREVGHVLWARGQDLVTRRIWLCTIAHSIGFVGAVGLSFVMRYWPLRGMCLCAMGHCTGFVSKPWAIAHNLTKKFHEKSCAMGHCAGFGYAP